MSTSVHLLDKIVEIVGQVLYESREHREVAPIEAHVCDDRSREWERCERSAHWEPQESNAQRRSRPTGPSRCSIYRSDHLFGSYEYSCRCSCNRSLPCVQIANVLQVALLVRADKEVRERRVVHQDAPGHRPHEPEPESACTPSAEQSATCRG